MTLPYAGTSGHSGTDTSAERAERRDTSGETARVQKAVRTLLDEAGPHGLTVAEIKKVPGFEHHGSTSSALSILHKADKISRLLDKRDGCRVYVANEHVDGRDTDHQGRKAEPVVDPVRTMITSWLTRHPVTGYSRAGEQPRQFILELRTLLDIP